MRELPLEFDGKGPVKGWRFRQILMSPVAYVYERTQEEQDLTYWEVFRRSENERFSVVSYPGENAFGVWAWCCGSYAKAEEKFNDLNKSK